MLVRKLFAEANIACLATYVLLGSVVQDMYNKLYRASHIDRIPHQSVISA